MHALLTAISVRARVPLCALLAASCGPASDVQQAGEIGTGRPARAPMADQILEPSDVTMALVPAPNLERNAYFGDLHIHTEYSFDAFSFGTQATPRDAYRFAKGEALRHPVGYRIQLDRPLDFYAVTDHAEWLGVARLAADTSSDLSRQAFSEVIHDLNAPDNMGLLSLGRRARVFASLSPGILTALADGSIEQSVIDDVARSAWRDAIEAADEANVPGRFTAFAGYEYTSSTLQRGNLHRNVIFRDTNRLPELPFSRLHSRDPEGLWDWMDGLREQGVEALAIPHNSNGSNGAMFERVDWAGEPIDDDYARKRLRNEPLVEVTQVKGTSETHPLLSSEDEWADFEIMPFRIATKLPSQPQGSYVREAYRTGLELASEGVANPYRFGLIGSTDSHVAGGSEREDAYFSKTGLIDGTAERRGSIPADLVTGAAVGVMAPAMVSEVEGETYLEFATYEFWGASGLTGVWAEENTRESIYAALRRKETFATTGPRMKVRFFAGYDLDVATLEGPGGIAHAYRAGVPMGGDLAVNGERTPIFWVWAQADPLAARLQRVQVVKGWEADGMTHERVFDVACSDGEVDPDTHRCPDNGARVNLADCSIDAEVGASELRTSWTDPFFETGVEAFYYVRVLENPTCRWSTWDALRAGVEPRPDLPTTVEERAFSSPIWYTARID